MSEDSLYIRIGADEGVRKLVTLFYRHMDSLPQARKIRDKHQQDLSDSREKLYQYFSGWFGGPPLFTDLYGHPRLRARHRHIDIGVADRDAWLNCLHSALDDMQLHPKLRIDLLEKIEPMADHMRNIDEELPQKEC